jgi:integrase/recombinase XerD
MKLIDAVNEFIAYRRKLGQRFSTDERNLRQFSQSICDGTRVADVTGEQIEKFLKGQNCLPQSRSRKQHSLTAFERFLVSRGYCGSLSLPDKPHLTRNTFVPYILSHDELRRLLDAVPIRQGRLLQTPTLRTVLLLLYGAGLRISEAIALNVSDVDVAAALLTVRESKFYKTRLVALGSQLNDLMTLYAKWRAAERQSGKGDAPFFVLRSGARLNQNVVRSAFHYLRVFANIRRGDGQRPRLHDLRHSFAVHRLLAWYRQEADVQTLLPKLAVYLGHIRLSCTQVYLSMTPELLQQASVRFEKYAAAEVRHE